LGYLELVIRKDSPFTLVHAISVFDIYLWTAVRVSQETFPERLPSLASLMKGATDSEAWAAAWNELLLMLLSVVVGMLGQAARRGLFPESTNWRNIFAFYVLKERVKE